ncbi:MAG: hypothetical protein H0V74_03820, partial [Chloroflexi bacterium]|nr:hypothetical protein [Chloroflexota bacterium]
MTDRPHGSPDEMPADETPATAEPVVAPEPESGPDAALVADDTTPGIAPGPSPIGRRARGAPAVPARAPTPSDRAVHVRDDVSKVFVIGTVAVFALILLNGL